MELKEVLISIFEKEIGLLRSERKVNDGDCNTYELEFVHQGIIILKILLMERTTNNWFIYHDLSKENPVLLKKMVYLCDRIKRIKESKTTSFTISGDLFDVKKEAFVKTVLKCAVQNLFNNFTLFRDSEAKKIIIPQDRIIGKIKENL